MTETDATAAIERLAPAPALTDLAGCDLVIEAAPESLELKHKLFGELSREVLREDAVIATNTSSLLVTAIASGAHRPERVVGMHFFNPAPVMRLLEVVAGEQSGALGPRRRAGRWRGDGQGRDRCGRRPRVPGQPLQPAVRARGAQAARKSGSPRSSRSTVSAASAAASGWARSS